MAIIALRRRREFEGWFWALWMTLSFLAFAFTVGRSIASRQAAGLGQVPLKPCNTCSGCACPKILGSARCVCPQ